jgi:thiol-disulfide isomerase/thioredoxin
MEFFSGQPGCEFPVACLQEGVAGYAFNDDHAVNGIVAKLFAGQQWRSTSAVIAGIFPACFHPAWPWSGSEFSTEIIQVVRLKSSHHGVEWQKLLSHFPEYLMNQRRVWVLRALLSCLLFGLLAGRPALASGDMPAFKADRWINSKPLTPEALRGKVVLVDFWEYTCINWMRTAPYVKAWNRDYGPAGLVVIGVHAPEFEFGKRSENLDRGIREHGLTYPIAADNGFAIWQSFGNDAWPAKYLFDAQGKLVKRWAGEGSYDEIESEIRRLLMAAHPGAALPEVSRETTAFLKAGEPSYAGITGEAYVGTERRESGAFRLDGKWRSRPQYIELTGGPGKITLPFTAGEVNLVAQPGPAGKSEMTVLLDGQPIDEARGADVGPGGTVRIDRSGMLRLVAGAPKGKHVLTLVSNDPGVRAYVFSFGP